MRSSWKFTPVENVFQRASTLTNLKTKDSLKSWAKGTRLFSDLLEKNLQVYNGVKFVDVLIKKEMLGAFGGSFVLTKRITSDIHHKTKRNKRGRQKKKKIIVIGERLVLLIAKFTQKVKRLTLTFIRTIMLEW